MERVCESAAFYGMMTLVLFFWMVALHLRKSNLVKAVIMLIFVGMVPVRVLFPKSNKKKNEVSKRNLFQSIAWHAPTSYYRFCNLQKMKTIWEEKDFPIQSGLSLWGGDYELKKMGDSTRISVPKGHF